MWKLTAEEKDRAVARYQAGENAVDIARSLGVSNTAMCGVLRRRGVASRSQREIQTRHTLRHGAFDEETPDSMYWAGFLFADGCLSYRSGQTPALTLRLSDRDRAHVEQLRAFLGSTHAITDISAQQQSGAFPGRPACQLSVRSERLCARLRDCGMLDGPVPNGLASSRHFWRGVVDGDGWLGSEDGRYPRLELVGAAWLLEAFSAFLVEVGVPGAAVRPHKSIYRVGLSGQRAVRCIQALYANAPTSLERKHNAAINIQHRAWAVPVAEAA